MTTNSPTPASAPFTDPSVTNPTVYNRAIAIGARPAAASVAAQFPDYLRYLRVCHPQDYVAALALGPKHGGLNHVLVGMGYPAASMPPEAAAPKEDGEAIRPKTPNW
ncbi:MAG: hypothetical protein EXR69_12540 [Myxococcales bacterium]|nr:hypothetical protein [Myxococcales bacterium]